LYFVAVDRDGDEEAVDDGKDVACGKREKIQHAVTPAATPAADARMISDRIFVKGEAGKGWQRWPFNVARMAFVPESPTVPHDIFLIQYHHTINTCTLPVLDYWYCSTVVQYSTWKVPGPVPYM
jgi:hypothetical protein